MDESSFEIAPDLHKDLNQTDNNNSGNFDHASDDIISTHDTETTSPPDELKETSKSENREREIFDSMSDTILQITKSVLYESDPSKKEAAKALLGDLLKARERYYFSIAQVLNPDIESVKEEISLYRLRNTEIYGSITAILDAQSTLENQRSIAELLKVPEQESMKVLSGAEVYSTALDSHISLAGSQAQERVQHYSADLDLVEYLKITAPNRQWATQIYSHSLVKHMETRYKGITKDGTAFTIYPKGLYTGGYIYNGEQQKTHRWSPEEVKQGFKTIREEDDYGHPEFINIDNVCNDPKQMYFEYICFTENDAFLISKLQMAHAQTPDEKLLFNSSVRQGKSYHEVYFSSPEDFDLTNQTLDPEMFVNYLTTMASEVRSLTNRFPPNEMKRMKRLYNFCKAQGDLTVTEEIEKVFLNPACHLYQQMTHLESALEVQRRFSDTGPYTNIRNNITSLLEDMDHPQALEALQFLSRGQFKKAKNVMKNIVNDSLASTIDENHQIQKKLLEVIKLKGGNNGYQ